ncbi:MAG TPA: hypothetical protein VMJ93_16135 [Verrucomicrobiae bacterium]|nr:hypothetical protein [Verrucomicrobiae bacterium]
MPFIRGRYHINPIAGEALEAAREAEAALVALEDAARERQRASGGDPAADDDNAASGAGASTGPIHRVEIEAAELVPSQTGRAGRGFVARVHRSVSIAPRAGSDAAATPLFSSRGSSPARFGAAPANSAGTSDIAVRPETHVFSNHGDLLNFLHDQFSREANA